MSKHPPIPPANRSPMGPGEPDHAKQAANPAQRAERHNADPANKGQQANTRINTTHQGHQQDR